MIKMVAFDLDGTISHTIPVGLQAFTEAIEPYTTKEITEEDVVKTYGLNEQGMMRILLEDHHDKAYESYLELYKKYHTDLVEPYEGIREIFALLAKKDAKVALITGRGHEACMHTLEQLKIKEIFCDIGTGREDRHCKCEIINALLGKYNLEKEEFLYIGDAVSDVIECNNAGVKCLSVCYGHNYYLEEVKKVNPDNMIYTIEELFDYLEKHTINKFLS